MYISELLSLMYIVADMHQDISALLSKSVGRQMYIASIPVCVVPGIAAILMQATYLNRHICAALHVPY